MVQEESYSPFHFLISLFIGNPAPSGQWRRVSPVEKVFFQQAAESKEPSRQIKRARRRTNGTLGLVLCSKAKALREQARKQEVRSTDKPMMPYAV